MAIQDIGKSLTQSFPEKCLGHIVMCVDPVSSNSTLSVAVSYFEEDELITSIPVEMDGGVAGLLHRETIEAKGKSTWEQLLNRSLNAFVDTNPRIYDSRENCEKVAAQILSDNQNLVFPDLLVFHRGRYFGIVPFKRLMAHVAEMRHQELNYAKELQEFLMHRGNADIRGYYYEILLNMSHELGGDFYQTLQLREELTMLACFDVSGKSVAASLSTSIISSYFATLEERKESSTLSPEEILSSLNNVLAETTPLDVFVTGIFYFIDTRENRVSIFNFGYSPVFMISQTGGSGKFTHTDPSLPPLGISRVDTPADYRADSLTVPIRNNLKFISYSDGLTDTENPKGVKFGQERVDAFLKEHFSANAKEFIAALEREISDFQQTAPQADDITVLVLQF